MNGIIKIIKLTDNNVIIKKGINNFEKYYTSEKPSITKKVEDKFDSSLFLKKIENRSGEGGLRCKGFFRKNIITKPLISIVMPNFRGDKLEKSIESILNQNYENLELIIIDGDSGHNDLNIIKKYDEFIDYWISEKDNGIWDAWNKGITLSSGVFVGIVDSSSIMDKNAMKIISSYIINNEEIDFILGTVKKENKIYSGYRPSEIKLRFNIIPSAAVGFFVKLSSLKKVGLYNTKYQISSDYDMLYRLIVKYKMKGIRTKPKEILGDLGTSGFSSKHNFLKLLLAELKIRFDNKQNIFILLYIFFGRCCMRIFQLLKN